MRSLVVPITLVILTVLFAIQRLGTGAVGELFGPVMARLVRACWRVAGPARGRRAPRRSCAALSPTYAVAFLLDHGSVGFLALGSVVLAVTGAEALYADMGHFGRPRSAARGSAWSSRRWR